MSLPAMTRSADSKAVSAFRSGPGASLRVDTHGGAQVRKPQCRGQGMENPADVSRNVERRHMVSRLKTLARRLPRLALMAEGSLSCSSLGGSPDEGFGGLRVSRLVSEVSYGQAVGG